MMKAHDNTNTLLIFCFTLIRNKLSSIAAITIVLSIMAFNFHKNSLKKNWAVPAYLLGHLFNPSSEEIILFPFTLLCNAMLSPELQSNQNSVLLYSMAVTFCHKCFSSTVVYFLLCAIGFASLSFPQIRRTKQVSPRRAEYRDFGVNSESEEKYFFSRVDVAAQSKSILDHRNQSASMLSTEQGSNSSLGLLRNAHKIKLNESTILTYLDESLFVLNQKLCLIYSNPIGFTTLDKFKNVDHMINTLKSFQLKSTLKKHILKCLEQKNPNTHETHNFYQVPEGVDSVHSEMYKKVKYCIGLFYMEAYDSVLIKITIKRKGSFKGNANISEAIMDMVSCSMFNDLSNIVNGINGNVEMIEPVIPQNMQYYYTNANLFCKILILKLRDIDDFTKVSTNKFKLHISSFNLWHMFTEFKDIISVYANLKQILISFDTKLKDSQEVVSDRDRILRVMMNITYVLIEVMSNGSINVSIKYTEMNEIDICISMFTQDKSKIAKLFKYSMTSIGNLQTPIENYDGISLVITSYIASKLGKGIDYDDSLCQIHIKIKDGFNLLAPPEIKGRPRKNSISDGICFEKKDLTMTTQVTPRLIQRTKLAINPSYSYFRKLLPFKIHTTVPDIECQSEKCDNASDMDVGNEFEEKNEIKDYIMANNALPRKIKTTSSISSRRKNRCSTFHSCTNNIINSEEIDIIIADDNIVSQSVLKRLLESFLFHPAIANDGSECVHIIENLLKSKSIHHLKLIFMDLQMPIMDGITATKEILKILKSNKISLPIIGVSADNNEQDRINFFNAGISEFIAKPVTKSKLDGLLTKYITR